MTMEFLQVAEAVAREKDIDKEDILGVMEQAIQMAGRRKHGMHLNVFAQIDRVTGDVVLKQLKEVVTEVIEPINDDELRLAVRENREPEMQPALDEKGKPLSENDTHILVKEAQKLNKEYKEGDFVHYDMPPVDFGRVAAQAAKQVIFQKVRDVERGKEFVEYEHLVGTIVSGIVKRADYNGVTIDMGRAEAFIPREELIQRESYRQNDRVRGYIYKVERSVRGPQIWVSRTHTNFLIEIFKEEVPEIASGVIEVMGAARDAGFRAKIAVKSFDRNLDPVGACVGIRGVRVQAVTSELQGERIDIIEWSADPAEFLVRAMSPSEVTKVVLDEDENRIEVVVPEDKLSLAIGRRGQNVRLASMLTGWDIDVMTEQEETDRRTNEYEAMSAMFIEQLDVDDTLARVLIGEGFTGVDELLQLEATELGNVEGLDADIAAELQKRAAAHISQQADALTKLDVKDDLLNMPGMRAELLLTLAGKGVKTLDDLGDLATDELLEMANDPTLTEKDAQRLIMAARQHWFDEEAAAAATEEAAASEKASA